jgi:D-alanine transaminase
VLLKQQAIAAGADEAILLRDGLLTEASTSSIYVVSGRELRMPPNGPELLPGTTRGLVEELADRNAIARREGAISERELRGADEVWLSAATRGVIAVTRLDGAPVGSGVPGPMWRRMYQLIEDWWNR